MFSVCCLLQACMRDIPSCKWLDQWTDLAQKYETHFSYLNATLLSTWMCTNDLCLFVWPGLHSSTTPPSSPEPWWCLAALVSGWATAKSSRSSESSARPALCSASTGWAGTLTSETVGLLSKIIKQKLNNTKNLLLNISVFPSASFLPPQGLESCLKGPDNYNSQVLIEATVIALTKLQPLLSKVYYHRPVPWLLAADRACCHLTFSQCFRIWGESSLT